MMGLSDGRESFKIGLAVLIQYWRVTDTQPPTQPPSQTCCRSYYRAYCVAQVKMVLGVKWARFKTPDKITPKERIHH